jgi:hypothetical protein
LGSGTAGARYGQGSPATRVPSNQARLEHAN